MIKNTTDTDKRMCAFIIFFFQLKKYLFWSFSKFDFDIFGSTTINDGLIPPGPNVYNFIFGWGLFKTGDLFGI